MCMKNQGMNWKWMAVWMTALCCLCCSSGNIENGEEPPVAMEMIVESVSSEVVTAAEGEFTVKVSSGQEVTARIEPSCTWITARSSVREGNLTTFVFAIAANTGEAREASVTFLSGSSEKTVTLKQEKGNVTGNLPAVEVAEHIGLGWNLGNQMDAYNNGVANETCWGNGAVTQATFDKLAAAGFTSVRIPVTWLGKVGAAPDYAIDAAWLNRVAELVGFAEKAGLKAIINIHHDGADSKNWLDIKNAAKDAIKNAAVKAQLKAMWTQIAEKFREKGDFLIFESMNEIQDGGWGWGDNRSDGGRQYAVLNEWNQVFVDAVRAVGGKNTDRYLGVPGYSTNPDLTMQYLKLPADQVDGRLLVAVHFYDPYQYTLEGQFSEWGHTGTAGKKYKDGDESNVRDVFSALKTQYVDKGIPVYIGEMGCVHRSNVRDEAFRKYYLEYVCKAARTYGLAPFYWDNGSTGAGRECSGLFERSSGAFVNNGEEIVAVMKRGYFTDDASYTLTSVYNSAP